jgi:hypothetical protein
MLILGADGDDECYVIRGAVGAFVLHAEQLDEPVVALVP